VLHQILQWHHLVSTPAPPDTVPNLELNTLFDGLFHAAAWAVTVAGVFVLLSAGSARAEPDGTQTLLGGALVGWGGFNLVEGVIDHHLLNVHHVRPGPDQLLYDVAFLVWGAAMAGVGALLLRHATGRTREAAAD
jgi:uncharacterized membrane protein